jgi:hypothetical protein
VSTDPNQIRQNLDQTQDELASDVRTLAEKTNPRRVAKQPVTRARNAYRAALDKIMGTVGPATETATSKAQSAAHKASDKVSETTTSAGEAVRSAPQMVRERAHGSPLAAGLIAFGAGMLISALLPRSEDEQQAAGRFKDMASPYAGKIKQEASGVAQHMREDLREPAQQAAESVKSTASAAAGKVKDEGRQTATDVKGQAQQARQNTK